jgi:hypothetical protein
MKRVCCAKSELFQLATAFVDRLLNRNVISG